MLLQTLKLSTHFSGIGSVEVALELVKSTAASVLGRALNIRAQAACEIDSSCRSAFEWVCVQIDVIP